MHHDSRLCFENCQHAQPYLRRSAHSPIKQFEVLNSKFGMATIDTRAILLTTYAKFVNLFPEIRDSILGVCV